MLREDLNTLSASINAIDKELRPKKTKSTQEILEKEIKESRDDDLMQINSGLSAAPLGLTMREEKSKRENITLRSFALAGGPELIQPEDYFTGFYVGGTHNQYHTTLLADLFPRPKEKKEISSESRSILRQKIINHFIQLGFPERWKDKIEISNLDNFLGETPITVCFISSLVPFEDIQEFVSKLQQLGLQCKASESPGYGLPDNITLYMELSELEKWLQNKVSNSSQAVLGS